MRGPARLLAWCALLLALAASGCPQTIEDEEYPSVQKTQPRYEADRNIPYEEFLVLMDGGQRQEFFELDSSDKRKRYLKENGIVVKKMLNDNLRRGMTKENVEKVLGVPEKKTLEDYAHFSSSRYDRLVDEWWVYQETGTGNLVFLPFKNGWLVDWLLEKKIRTLVFSPTGDEKVLRQKQGKLIHLQEEIPSLLRRPGEPLEMYKERLKRIAPIVFSESPPRWPNEDLGRKLVPQSMYQKLTQRDIYALWGKTAKIFELALPRKPELPYDKFTRWVYRVFNGRDFTFYSVYFTNGKVVDWEVDTSRM
jgi:hypothetical protein